MEFNSEEKVNNTHYTNKSVLARINRFINGKNDNRFKNAKNTTDLDEALNISEQVRQANGNDKESICKQIIDNPSIQITHNPTSYSDSKPNDSRPNAKEHRQPIRKSILKNSSKNFTERLDESQRHARKL